MKKAYEEIIARLTEGMRSDARSWHKPWKDASEECPNVIQDASAIDAVLDKYYKHERISYIEKEQNNSFYSPDADVIILPLKKQFESMEAYCAVKAHETIHSSGDYTRCNRETFREFTSFRFGDMKYSREELVAEIGACFLLYELGIDTSRAEANACVYLNNWIDRLNHNTKWVYKASALAEEAVEYILESAGREM